MEKYNEIQLTKKTEQSKNDKSSTLPRTATIVTIGISCHHYHLTTATIGISCHHHHLTTATIEISCHHLTTATIGISCYHHHLTTATTFT